MLPIIIHERYKAPISHLDLRPPTHTLFHVTMSLIPPFTASHLANDGMNRDIGVCESSGVNYMTGGFGNLLEFGVFYQNSNSFYNPGSSYVPIETYPSLYPTSMASAPPYQSPNTLYNSAGDENGQGIGRSAGAQLNVGWSEPSLGFLDSDTSSFGKRNCF